MADIPKLVTPEDLNKQGQGVNVPWLGGGLQAPPPNAPPPNQNITNLTPDVPPASFRPVRPGLTPALMGGPQPLYPTATEADIGPKKEQPKPVVSGSGGGKPQESLERQNLKEQQGLSEDYLKTLQGQQETVKQQQDILREGRDKQADLMAKAEMQERANQLGIKMMSDKVDSDAKARDIELSARAEELRNTKIDPAHWWHEKGTAGSILAAIAIGAGAFGAAMPHTANHENAALDIINKAIDRDVNSQENNLNNKWKALNLDITKSDKDYVRDQWKINQMREDKLVAYNHAIAAVGMQRQNTQDEVAAKGLDNMVSQLQQEKIKVLDQMRDQRMQVALKERAAAQAGSGSNLPKKYEAYVQDWLRKDPKARGPYLNYDQYKKAVGGNGYEGGGSGGAGALDPERIEAAKSILKNNARIRQLQNKGNLTQADRAEYDKLVEQNGLSGPYAFSGSKRFNTNESDTIKAMYPNYDAWLRTDARGRAIRSLDTMDQRLKDIIGDTGSNVSATEEKE